MKRSTPKEVFETYKKRFTYNSEFELEQSPNPELRFAIVIPCFNEPNLLVTLNSLLVCDRPSEKFEVLVVVNQPQDASDEIQSLNRNIVEAFKKWKTTIDSNIDFYCIEAMDFPPKKAGVGLARKTGMDLAASRFAQLDKLGWIINLDADCEVSFNYLTEVEKNLKDTIRGGHFYFEHRLDEIDNENLKIGITLYELHLRYYAQALKYAGFKFWNHTVGSCIIARSDVYALQGGMNQRKAGEDFYFMHKIMPGGDCIEINQATVYPSARISDRVPFGTGKAQGDWVESGDIERMTYSFDLFSSLSLFFTTLGEWYAGRPDLNEYLNAFLMRSSFDENVSKIKKRSSSLDVFSKNLTQFCDGFFTLKMVHFLRDTYFGEENVVTAANNLLSEIRGEECHLNAFELLTAYRELDRHNE